MHAYQQLSGSVCAEVIISLFIQQEVDTTDIIGTAVLAFGPHPTVVASQCEISESDCQMPGGYLDLVVGHESVDDSVLIVYVLGNRNHAAQESC